MICIPKYLREIAEVTDCKAEKLTVKIGCPCGCFKFLVLKNITKDLLTREEKAQIRETNKWEEDFTSKMLSKYGYSIIFGGEEQEEYHEYIVYKAVNETEEGKILKRVRIEKGQIPLSTNEIVKLLGKQDSAIVFKVVCADCGKEYLLFDSRIHGNDAAEDKPQTLEEYKFKPKKIGGSDAPAEIIISLKNFWDFDDIAGNGNEDLTADDYSEMFGYIAIKAVTVDGKTITVYSEDLG